MIERETAARLIPAPTLPGARDTHKRRSARGGDNHGPGPPMRQCNMDPCNADTVDVLADALADYRRRWAAEAGTVDLFTDLLEEHDHPFTRGRLAGHFTASAWLMNRAGTRVLLTHHRKLGRWLQLGGHADGDRDLARAALKEAHEESGLSGLSVEREIFDLDRHWIPEHKGVPAHWHYDVRYVVHAGGSEDFVVSDESHDLAWRGIATLADDEDADSSLRRMARKWLQRR
jgi:8-oxo-dGTP pyrophosphatase MutT (NUDIX family)